MSSDEEQHSLVKSPVVASPMKNRKRGREGVEDFGEVSDVGHASPSASVHGVVNMLSPMKQSKSCSFFDGKISDGKSSMRLFGFDSGVRRKLLSAEESKNPVALVNCEVKHSRHGQELEVRLEY